MANVTYTLKREMVNTRVNCPLLKRHLRVEINQRINDWRHSYIYLKEEVNTRLTLIIYVYFLLYYLINNN